MTLKTADLDLAVPVTGEAPCRRAGVLTRESRTAYAFIAPAFFLLTFLVAYPFVLSVWFSLSDARVGTTGSFVGLGNFGRLFSSSIFVQTLQNSILFTAAALTAKIVLGMALALLLFRIKHFKRLIRGAVLLPFIVPTALSTLVWWWMFEPLYSVVNWTLKSLRLADHDIPWLPDPYLAMFVVILVNVWRGLPFFAITLLAGLVAIPRELYEAAEADGAGPVGRFWHITLPLLTPVLAVVILFSAIFTLSDFNIVYVLTKGGPMNMTHLFATYSFALGLQGGEIGQGAAVSLFLFPILLAVVFLQLRLVRKAALYE
ncbi:sugar ABC transporter permease [Vineibacter terrae]|uniref:Sugar ABC transporter permease n=1 Tax=Vineibacter terrae TaxID=2586908 RepID=A0A5C8PTN5_9HYPH|nr:sugar ABC transporter permease [Vineibacter terrae]TXL81688.1 sugar ABC transporter permease [Vineibacter terrae]